MKSWMVNNMKAIVCVDDDYGILFNNRRVSRDRSLIQWLVNYSDNNKIWMRPYSKELFDGYDNINVSDKYLDEAGTDDYCFVEDSNLPDYIEEVECILLCKWNRRYPSDVKFQHDLLDNNWSMSVQVEFSGTSHEKITIEEWSKNVRN